MHDRLQAGQAGGCRDWPPPPSRWPRASKPDTTGTIEDTQTKKKVAAILLTPVSITKDNISVPIKDGYVKLSDVCTAAYQAKCTAAGVTG